MLTLRLLDGTMRFLTVAGMSAIKVFLTRVDVLR